ncbi:MAG: glutamine-hydrolyzing carbamoyl-phosphate synthase small subunit [Alphaproteobacteria bacterium]
MTEARASAPSRPNSATAVLVLADGSVFWGVGAGARRTVTGELCFNTAMSGYQEIMTDPSYASQIITFTFPHIGNVGTNGEDIETTTPAALGCILRETITPPSNWRAAQPFDQWLLHHNLPAISGVDTRALTRAVRDQGAQAAVLSYPADGVIDRDALVAAARAWPGLEGMDLARTVTCGQTHEWTEGRWSLADGFATAGSTRHHVVAVDYGIKRNILRCLVSAGCRVTVVPATAGSDDILRHRPDGVFLSNGPGDPAATGAYAVPAIQGVLDAGLPVFGICLGHQMLALALGGSTEKMHHGHRGANHPVKDLETGRIEITSQNHGFVVADRLPAGVIKTHESLFDHSLEGLRVEGRPVFGVQYHPEASPGPQDSHYLFQRFVEHMDRHAETH